MERIDEKNDPDKSGDDFMMPGFRFHPTDEELVEFYLKRKLQHRPLQIELIKQVDIYKYDPWDLPKVASTGEKEWYFYCPRDRKYRNSARPNRVTGAGFWKATGTDRPIYSSSHGDKCIGLKKSLVFYRGRAARGIKTDWMMHEFRLPSATDGGAHHKTLPPTDSWAICRIFKKPSSTANRGIAHNWTTPSSSTTTPSDFEFGNPSALSIASNTTTAETSSANEDYNLAFSEASNASNKTTFDLASSLFFNQSPALYEEARKNSQSLDLELIQLEGINGGDDQEGFKKNTWATNTHHLWEDITAQDSWAPDLQWDVRDSGGNCHR